ncbi:MAG: OmpH family outer membrane protein [Gemmatimonadota bacterium]|jgi:outer membrane protein
MRRISFVTAGLIALATLAGSTAAAGQQAVPRIAYINSERILQATPEVQDAQESLGAELQGYRDEVQQMADDLEQMIQQYEQRQLTMSAEAKEQRESEIRAKQQEYRQRVQQLDQQAAQRQSEVVQPIMDRINQVIEQIRAEGDYAMIFDVSAGAIIAADPALDLTEEVITRLDQASDSASGSGN